MINLNFEIIILILVIGGLITLRLVAFVARIMFTMMFSGGFFMTPPMLNTNRRREEKEVQSSSGFWLVIILAGLLFFAIGGPQAIERVLGPLKAANEKHAYGYLSTMGATNSLHSAPRVSNANKIGYIGESLPKYPEESKGLQPPQAFEADFTMESNNYHIGFYAGDDYWQVVDMRNWLSTRYGLDLRVYSLKKGGYQVLTPFGFEGRQSALEYGYQYTNTAEVVESKELKKCIGCY